MSESLFRIATLRNKSPRVILGLMSGTSIDGLDLALCSFSNSGAETRFEILHHTTVSYEQPQRAILQTLATADKVAMEDLCIYHTELSHWHGAIIKACLAEWRFPASDVDAIAWHGQTVRHAPKRIHRRENLPNATFQLGEPDHLAYITGIPVISDFRQKHVAAGGEGAPLAVYGDRILFSEPGEFRILLNIGGIANITVLDGNLRPAHLPQTFDTGPGNTLIDLTVRKHFPPLQFDDNGSLAANGQVHDNLLKALKSHSYFEEPPPKTTGPELLSASFLEKMLSEAGASTIPPEDILATLCQFTAETIADSIHRFVQVPSKFKVYVSGGGVHNRTLITKLKSSLPHADVLNFETLGVHPDAKEALFFGALANELLAGNRFPVLREDGSFREVHFGKISLPD